MRAVVAFLLALAAASPVRADEPVRIAVGRFREAFVVDGVESVLAPDGARVKAGRKVRLSPGPNGLLVDGAPSGHDVLRVEAKGMLSLGGHQYRRVLEASVRKSGGKLEALVVHPIPLEEYVVGIVSAELPASWPLEAMKAQAVAARTYAVWQKYRRLELPYHMEATVLDQVYGGAQRETDDARRAVKETAGLVLSSQRRLARTYFFASCGDRTESAAEGWGTPLPYLPGSPCGYCSAANRFTWTAQVPRKDLDAKLKPILGESVRDVVVATKTKTGRAKDVVLKGATRTKKISGGDLRRLLGYSTIWSTWITKLEVTKDGARIEGRGAGHGVGLCQWGARGMAERGATAEQILDRYYPGAVLRRLY